MGRWRIFIGSPLDCEHVACLAYRHQLAKTDPPTPAPALRSQLAVATTVTLAPFRWIWSLRLLGVQTIRTS